MAEFQPSRFVLTEAGQRHWETSLVAAGAPEGALMESVAAQMAEALVRRAPRRITQAIFLVGPGNNGADALAVARYLKLRHPKFWRQLRHREFLVWPSERLSPLRKFQAHLAGVRFTDLAEFSGAPCEPTLVVDGLWGLGALTRPVRDIAPALQMALAKLAALPAWRVAIDLPSGLGFADPKIFPLEAHLCLCAGGPKREQMEEAGARASGRLKVIPIFSEAPASLKFPQDFSFYWRNPHLPALWVQAHRAQLSFRRAPLTAHKNTRGRVLAVGGTLVRGGALTLAAQGALRAGVGYATVVEPHWDGAKVSGLPLVERVRAAGEWVSAPFAQTEADWEKLFTQHSALIFGCGILAGGEDTKEAGGKKWQPFFTALAKWLAVPGPECLVVDGGGLASWADHLPAKFSRTVVLTPHPKEAQDLWTRLGGGDAPSSRFDLFYGLRERLQKRGVRGALLLKGAYPLTSEISSEAPAHAWNLASPHLATAGSGDVLSGFVAALTHRLYSPPPWALASETHAHYALAWALAAQAAAVRKLKPGAIASDIAAAMGAQLPL